MNKENNISNNNVVIDEKRLNGWTIEHENVFIEWSDKAMCYRWLHSKSYKYYSFRNAWFTIPVIIMSTITGTANFAQERIPIQYKLLAQMLIGGINIIAGIMTTIQQFLKITELNEAHRVSAVSWGKFVRNITVILAKSPLERENTPIELLNRYKEEFDRLMEISPDIEDKVLKKFKMVIYNKEKDEPESCCEVIAECFNKCFCFCISTKEEIDAKNSSIQNLKTLSPDTPSSDSKTTGSNDGSNIDEFTKELKKKYKLKKPEICGEFVSVSENRHPWYKQEKIVEKIEMPVIEPVEIEFDYTPYIKLMNDKIELFKKVRGREPLTMELKNNLTGEVTEDVINHIMKKLHHKLHLNINNV